MLYRKFYRMHNQLPYSNCTYLSSTPTWSTAQSAVWDPYLSKDTEHLEKTQKFELIVCMKSWSLGYDELLSDANVQEAIAS
jgi:lysyl-tRNA synthetase class II